MGSAGRPRACSAATSGYSARRCGPAPTSLVSANACSVSSLITSCSWLPRKTDGFNRAGGVDRDEAIHGRQVVRRRVFQPCGATDQADVLRADELDTIGIQAAVADHQPDVFQGDVGGVLEEERSD